MPPRSTRASFRAAGYVARDEEAKHNVFMVLREAMRKSGTMALSRVVIAKSGKKLICHTLHDQAIGLIPVWSGRICPRSWPVR